jgi:peptidoglycan/LPS O-acetylase OafA/YrhL
MQPALPATKPHYLILDGLRGLAAILVVIFHLFEAYYPVPANHPMHHGYLAVDFFFLLSGFVIGYAYDDRWEKMTVWQFFKIRLVRLHPMVLMGAVIGAIGFWFDPFTAGHQPLNLLQLIGIMLMSMTLLPGPDIRSWGETHPLNGPFWSLLQEYIGNILYALFIRKAGKISLWLIVLASAGLLVWVATHRGDVATGWGYDTIWIATVRMLFPFFAGLLLFRSKKIFRLPFAFPLCALLLIIVFFLPTFRYNGLYESASIIIVFPLIVAMGAGGKLNASWAKICKFSGDISYPLYITHYPFIYIYTMWIVEKKPAPAQILPIVGGLFTLFIALAWLLLKYYDEPVRAWLQKKFLLRK